MIDTTDSHDLSNIIFTVLVVKNFHLSPNDCLDCSTDHNQLLYLPQAICFAHNHALLDEVRSLANLDSNSGYHIPHQHYNTWLIAMAIFISPSGPP
jgi:hypothetical protein